MSNWAKQDTDEMRRQLENIYMLALRKRVVTHQYPEGFPEVPAIAIGPRSTDEAWDDVIRFCEQAGLRPTIVRTQAPRLTVSQQDDSQRIPESHPIHDVAYRFREQFPVLQSVGVSIDMPGRPDCLIAFCVSHKDARHIPVEFEGFPVVFDYIGKVVPAEAER